jgi:hypothetical protein
MQDGTQPQCQAVKRLIDGNIELIIRAGYRNFFVARQLVNYAVPQADTD